MSINDAKSSHDLLEGTRRGLWNPSAAQARADELGLGSLNALHNSHFDVLRLHRWTLPMAICWIARRDKEAVCEYWPLWRAFRREWQAVSWRFYSQSGEVRTSDGYALVEVDECPSFFWELEHADDTSPPTQQQITYTAARSILWEKLKGGLLIAEGRPRHAPRLKPLWSEIRPTRWRTMKIDDDSEEYDRLCCTVNGKKLRYRGDVLLRTEDLLRLWPQDLSDRNLTEVTTKALRPKADHKREIIHACAGTDPNWRAMSTSDRQEYVRKALAAAGFRTGFSLGSIRDAVRGTEHQWWVNAEQG